MNRFNIKDYIEDNFILIITIICITIILLIIIFIIYKNYYNTSNKNVDNFFKSINKDFDNNDKQLINSCYNENYKKNLKNYKIYLEKRLKNLKKNIKYTIQFYLSQDKPDFILISYIKEFEKKIDKINPKYKISNSLKNDIDIINNNIIQKL